MKKLLTFALILMLACLFLDKIGASAASAARRRNRTCG